MKHLLLLGALLVSSWSMAGELDQDQTNQGLNGTVVVRVDSRTQDVSVLKTDAIVQNTQEAVALTTADSFLAAPAQNIKSELDQESGSSSWYWYCGYRQPTYLYWYGYTYYPTYTYSYSYYTYYYYSWYRW